MKKNIFVKRFFAVLAVLLILSALLIPCFADNDYSTVLGGVYYLPVSEAGIAYNTLLNSSGTYYIGDLPTSDFDYSDQYRGSFIACDDDANYFVTHSFTDSSSFTDPDAYILRQYTNDIGYFETTVFTSALDSNFEFLVNDGEGNYSSLAIFPSSAHSLDINFYCYFRLHNQTLPSFMTDVLDTDVLVCGVKILGDFGDWFVTYHEGYQVPIYGTDVNDYSFSADITLYTDGTMSNFWGGYIYTVNRGDAMHFGYDVEVCTYIKEAPFNVIMSSFMNVEFAPDQRYSCFVPSVIVNPPDSPSDPPSDDSSFFSELVQLIFAIFQAPAVFLSSILDFTIFGVNLYHVFKVILTISLTGLIVGTVVKIVLHFKS